MSLVQEPLIHALNRRFYFYFFDAFVQKSGGGGLKNEKAKARVEDTANAVKFWNDAGAKHLGGMSGGGVYAGLFQPDGEKLAELGFGMKEFYAAILKTKEQVPSVWELNESEAEVIRRAAAMPQELSMQLAAAQIHYELLDFDAANQVLDTFCEATEDDAERQRARYQRLHYDLARNSIDFYQYAQDLKTGARKKLAAQRRELKSKLVALTDLAKDVDADRWLDTVVCDLELKPKGMFFSGFQWTKGVDHQARIVELASWVEHHGETNKRVGECLFLLGLAHRAAGSPEKADSTWKDHFERFPADRFAALSRIHITDYQFSPYKSGGGMMVMGGQGKSMTADQVDKQIEALSGLDKTKEGRSDKED